MFRIKLILSNKLKEFLFLNSSQSQKYFNTPLLKLLTRINCISCLPTKELITNLSKGVGGFLREKSQALKMNHENKGVCIDCYWYNAYRHKSEESADSWPMLTILCF